jgi:2-C-methyl-D-erythritol 4-phosphate cytidylyltransferase
MGGVKKEYRPLGKELRSDGKPITVLDSAVRAFLSVPRVALVVITVPLQGEQGEVAARAALDPFFFGSAVHPPILFVPGGNSRRSSVHHALTLLTAYHPDFVLIHDGARPWIRPELINRTIDAAIQFGAVIPGLPLVETPKEIDPSGQVVRHLRRASVVSAQTPQGFAFPELLRAHERAGEEEINLGREFTDDAEVWGSFIGPVMVIPGEAENRKITFPEDLP